MSVRSATNAPPDKQPSSERGQAQTALHGEQQLRAQLENDLAQTQRRLEAAEKARGAAIKSLEQAATRPTSTSRRNPQSQRPA